MTEDRQFFFERLERLSSGERAALRRKAGVMLRESGSNALFSFYRCLPANIGEAQAEKWFAIACLSCLWDAGEVGAPLEKQIAHLIQRGELSDSIQKRVEILLDTQWDNDGYMLTKLTRLIKLVRQKTDQARIDFPSLLDDLIKWNDQYQRVQRKWARAIFGKTNEEVRD